MADISSYPQKAPKAGDLILFSETYDVNAANPVVGNPTKSATIQGIIDLVPSSGGGGGSGTVTSVGLSTNIVAFTVASSPITSSGTITLNLNGGSAGQFLRQDGNWAAIPGGNAGTVTDVQATNGAGISTSVTNSTSTPNITITNTDLGSSQNIFKNFAVSGQTTIAADSNDDTLTLVAGSNVTITTDATTDAITINAASVTNTFATDITVNGVLVGAGSNANADENTRIGKLSLGQSSGNFNTAVGWSALRYNSSGQYNTAIGNASMSQYIISGSSNVGVGYRSLRALSSGLSNVAVGNNSLVAISGGSANVAIGTGALDSLVNSDFNVSLGSSSLGGLVTGERNVAMGSSAGGVNRNSLNDSVFVGHGSSSNSDGQTNQIVIGATATGNGSNTATLGNNSITELHVGGNGAGLVLKSPNGTAYTITVTDAGALVVT